MVDASEAPSLSYRDYSPQPQRAAGFNSDVPIALTNQTFLLVVVSPPRSQIKKIVEEIRERFNAPFGPPGLIMQQKGLLSYDV
jgi:hypothetical protein